MIENSDFLPTAQRFIHDGFADLESADRLSQATQDERLLALDAMRAYARSVYPPLSEGEAERYFWLGEQLQKPDINRTVFKIHVGHKAATAMAGL